ncbi:UNC-50 [Polychaeton citri CBS 116435]|uniref:UNC-50 n=1 Tax=Polychaeton citri CBS 116435 TaxID=1314669 RepID=A0A9P4PWG3_9PEZI|nr:UNC-50 [Polychaeton citri CBS 116435]
MSSHRRSSMRIPPFFRRLFKFQSLDFETAIWEMINLIIAPKKVFRNIYYHKQTKNSYHRADPAFTYLLSLFLILTGLAWGLAYAPSTGGVIKVAVFFPLIHFLLVSVLVSTLMFFLVGRVLGQRRNGLFGPASSTRASQGAGGMLEGEEALEFGYCFDVSIRAFLPLWLFLYVLQFLLMPLIAQDYWLSNFTGNSTYLLAICYYFIITFLGYNALPFLSKTEVLLAPVPVLVVIWFISLFTFDCATNLAPILWCGVNLKRPV